jgi:hypothetical protein
VAESWGQFGDSYEGGRPPLQDYPCEDSKLRRLSVHHNELWAATVTCSYELCPINPVTNPIPCEVTQTCDN